MTMEMGRVTLGSDTATPAQSGETVAQAVAEVRTQQGSSAATGDMDVDLETLARLEAIAPGYAKAWLEAETSEKRGTRLYRLVRLALAGSVAAVAIACGQWALVNGASDEALYLSSAGLVGLIGAFLGKKER